MSFNKVPTKEVSPKEVRPKDSTRRHQSDPRSRSGSIDSESGPSHREGDERPSYREGDERPSYREHASIVPEIQPIPARRFSRTPTGARRTRSRVSQEDMATALYWTNDYDNDMVDFVNK
jgi:hypothetical protein